MRFSDDEYYEEEWYPTMIGSVMDLYPQEPEEPKRRHFWQRKTKAEPLPPQKKPTFGFGRVLDEDNG